MLRTTDFKPHRKNPIPESERIEERKWEIVDILIYLLDMSAMYFDSPEELFAAALQKMDKNDARREF